jgi:DNA repair exonuclease SbcCD ATPase subunit
MTKTDQILLEEVRSIKQRLDDMDMGLEKDRERLQDLTIRLENVETEVKETRRAINRSSEVIKNKVADVVEPVLTSNEELKEEVKNQDFVFVKEAKSWWQKLTGR